MLPVTPVSVGKSTQQLLAEAGEFYYDLALSSNPPTLKALFEVAKRGYVLFGSDYPNAPGAAICHFTEFLEGFEPEGEALSEVLVGNAAGLFPRLRRYFTVDDG